MIERGRLSRWGITPRGLSRSSSRVITRAAGSRIHCFCLIMLANSPLRKVMWALADYWAPRSSAASFWAIIHFGVLSWTLAPLRRIFSSSVAAP
jgi:hypothetical protein